MKKVMFICTGNICRSAMAEGMFKKILKDKGIENVEVCSAGIYAETGAYATDEAIEAAKELYDVDILNIELQIYEIAKLKKWILSYVQHICTS